MPNNINRVLTKPLGFALWQERCKRGLRLNSIQKQTDIPLKLLDRIELGKSVPPSFIKKLLIFYNKNIKIELID